MPTDPPTDPAADFSLAAALSNALLLVRGTMSGFLGLTGSALAGAAGVAADLGVIAPFEMGVRAPLLGGSFGIIRLVLDALGLTLVLAGRALGIDVWLVLPESAPLTDVRELRVLRVRTGAGPGEPSGAPLNEDGGPPEPPPANF